MGVGRVIARPFTGASGGYTPHREPARLRAHAVRADPLDVLKDATIRSRDWQDRRLCRPRDNGRHSYANDDEGMDEIAAAMEKFQTGLIFANLVDFDTLFGHRNLSGLCREPGEMLPRWCTSSEPART